MRLQKYWLACCFALALLHTSIQAQVKQNVIVLQNDSQAVLATKYAQVFIDSSNRLDVAAIQAPHIQAQFVANGKNIFLKPTGNSCWLKFDIHNQTGQKAWIALDNAFIAEIEFYAQQNGQYRLIGRTGAQVGKESKLYPVNTFWLPVSADSALQTVYVRFPEQLSVAFPIHLGTTSALHQLKTADDYIFGAFIGLIVIMFGYNLFLFFAVRDRIYLLYLLYLFLAFLVVPFLNHYQFVAEWLPSPWDRYMNSHLLVWQNFIFITIGVFAIQFLGLKSKMPRYRVYLLGLLAVVSGFIPLATLFDWLPRAALFDMFQLLVLVLYLSLLWAGFYLWLFKKDQSALFYTLAWVWVIASTIVFVLYINGVVPYHPITRNITIFGVGLEILFFSLALGNRINIMRREKELTQAENMRLVQEQNMRLEQMVAERTEEINQQNEELEQTLSVVSEQKNLIERKNKDIVSSINYALRIQRAIMPAVQEVSPYFADSMVLYKPKNIVSGDFYWFSAIHNTHSDAPLLIAIADCTGHGVAGAFMTIIGKNLLDQIVNEDRIYSPAKVLAELDARLLRTLQQQDGRREKIEDGMDISLLCFYPQSQKLTWASAKRPLWVLHRAQESATEYKGSKYPIGGSYFSEKHFAETEIDVQKGDLIYAFTDGYADQFGPQGKLMIKRFKTLVQAHQHQPLAQQQALLEQHLQQWRSTHEQTDDVLVMALRI